MPPVLRPLLVALRGLAVLQLSLGGALWAGYAGPWRTLHLGLGVGLGLALLALGATVTAVARRPGALLIVGAWTVLLVAYGVGHARLLPGSAHWVAQVAHVLLGLATLGLAEWVAGRAGRAGPRRVVA